MDTYPDSLLVSEHAHGHVLCTLSKLRVFLLTGLTCDCWKWNCLVSYQVNHAVEAASSSEQNYCVQVRSLLRDLQTAVWPQWLPHFFLGYARLLVHSFIHAQLPKGECTMIGGALCCAQTVLPDPSPRPRYLQMLNERYGYPVWLTEFSCGDGAQGNPTSKHLAFMKEIFPMLDAAPFVFRSVC
jgi:hypothetical protein